MRTLFSAMAILIGLQLTSCSRIIGEGPVVSEIRTISSFSSVKTACDADVYIRQDSFFRVEVTGQQNILNALNTSVSGKELKIDFDYNKRIGHHDKIQVYISCPNIEGLSVSGSGNTVVAGRVSGSSLKLAISGSGTMTLAQVMVNAISASVSGSGDILISDGSADNVHTAVSGSGMIDMLGVQTVAADIHTSGSGNTKIKVSETLKVHISGSGNVYYRGRPQIDLQVSGSGKIISLQ